MKANRTIREILLLSKCMIMSPSEIPDYLDIIWNSYDEVRQGLFNEMRKHKVCSFRLQHLR